MQRHKALISGAIATVPMTAVMLMAQRLGLLGQLPPDKITKAILRAIDAHLPKPARAIATTANHFAFGAAMGGVFGVLGSALGVFGGRHPVARGVGAGVVWGTIVWAASYSGWVPALGIMPRPSRDRPGRPLAMIAAHWVYGAVLGGLVAATRTTKRRATCER